MNDRIEQSDRVKQKYMDKLGNEFGAIFHGLQNDWAVGLVRIKEFRKLFDNTTHIELLEALGGGFFTDIHHILWDDLMLHVTRLTDPRSTAGKDNLTVQRLPTLCKDQGLHNEVQTLVDVAVDTAEFARDWRNRRISHTDLTRAMELDPEPLAPASTRQAAAALDAVHAVLNTISVRLLGEGIANDVVMRPRAAAFVAYARQLVEAVQYIDSFIDPSGTVPITDLEVASAFLRKLGRAPTMEHVRQVIELREAARRFK